jgi:prepilin-type N-terminal cleavage/methylation domain-containing protein
MIHSANKMAILRLMGGMTRTGGFTLLEVITALAILALVSSSVLVVIDRCVGSAANSALRMEAFQLAQENLEKILASDSITEEVEYGTSDKYPEVFWQTVIEAFPEPVTGQMWVRAVCSAGYLDSTDETQTVELEHWITELTDQQAGQLMQQEDLDQLAADQLLETVEEAAEYADVENAVIEEWIDKGLVLTEDGSFIRYNLDVFVRSSGDPTAEEKRTQVRSIRELAMSLRAEQEWQEGTGGRPAGPDGRDPAAGLSREELEKMDAGEIMDLVQRRQR